MNLDDALHTFILESRELLQEMESALLTGNREQEDTVNAIFRAAHTIKGSAGLFGLDHVVGFTHVVESVLDRMRDGALALDDTLVALLLGCCDHINELIDALDGGNMDADPDLLRRGAPLLEQLDTYLAPGQAAPAAEPVDTPAAATGGARWHISLRFGSEVLRNGMDPLAFIRYLERLGSITRLVTLPDAVPALEDLDPEACHLGFEIALASGAAKEEIEDVFDFVRDDCRIGILPSNAQAGEFVRLIGDLPEGAARLGEILVRCGSITELELEAALREQSLARPGAALIGEVLVGQGSVPPAVVDAALGKQKQSEKQAGELRAAQESRSVRVDADKLDHLINLVGELIIAGASASLIARRHRIAELQECTSTLSGLVEEVRDSALQLRMVKIGATFNRFQRVVHDVSREIGKDIGLVVSGEDTELDKTVVEKIADPLTHLVRNAIDHGIEAAELRMARGKPARGTVRLNAYHDSGSIVIEVGDDGGGLKRERILAKAIERGLVEPGRVLSDSETYALIFEPGFSTADQVTNLSGRGVGMDVVKSNIAALRGSVDIASEEGVGTTVTVRLPLTLAIIDGFLVGVGKTSFVVPLDTIEECVEFSSEPGHDYTNLRGEILPFVRLRSLFGIEGAPARRESIVVVKQGGRKAGLVVDSLLGEFQTVIKPLGKMFNGVSCISGSTILGSGEVALIVDVPALLKQVGHDTPLAA
ncbi:chemotaxis protein CheA [Massilia sp. ST3]|uniref:chemotaxis protein CheA n=1 Tax=Massilia sp. ST3 TaxID=2824903 RepID=UPI001B81D293|nr:chemotaxis protein CheA [Massilia sp. ST3]